MLLTVGLYPLALLPPWLICLSLADDEKREDSESGENEIELCSFGPAFLSAAYCAAAISLSLAEGFMLMKLGSISSILSGVIVSGSGRLGGVALALPLRRLLPSLEAPGAGKGMAVVLGGEGGKLLGETGRLPSIAEPIPVAPAESVESLLRRLRLVARLMFAAMVAAVPLGEVGATCARLERVGDVAVAVKAARRACSSASERIFVSCEAASARSRI